MALKAELLKPIWHAFTALDVDKSGKVSKSQLKENSDYWKPAVCMNFLDAFLSFVKKVVTEDNHEVVYTFSWKVHEDVHYSVKRGPEHCFLLPEYIESVMSTGGLATQPLLNRGQAEAQ